MKELRFYNVEHEGHFFTQTSSPNNSTLRALFLSFVINGLLLLALAIGTKTKSISHQTPQLRILEAVLLQPNKFLKLKGFPKKRESQLSLEQKMPTNTANDVDVQDTEKPHYASSYSDKINVKPLHKKNVGSEVSVEAMPNVLETSKAYINKLNRQRLHDIPEQPLSRKLGGIAVNNFHNRRIEDHDYMESIEIVVDCSTLKGKLFSALSKNKGVTIDNRDFPALAGDATRSVQGTVKCRDHRSFQIHIDRYLNKLQ